MEWIHDFGLFLFDLDGLLVDTESLHYQAYVNLCRKRGFHLDWSFVEFCAIAHSSSEGLKEEIYAKFPSLYEKEPNWNVLYEEKKKEYLSLLQNKKIPLMPGAHALLEKLQEENIPRCVVTNSLKEQTDFLKAKVPLLQTIPHWITRESYEAAKPHPECYLKAIQLFSQNKPVIGFEDSLRGLKALLQTKATPVLVSEKDPSYFSAKLEGSWFHFPHLSEIPSQMNFLKVHNKSS